MLSEINRLPTNTVGGLRLRTSLSSRDDKRKAKVFRHTDRTFLRVLQPVRFWRTCFHMKAGVFYSSVPHNTRFLQALQAAVKGIICLVVHDEFVVHKIETVWSGLVWMLHHLASWKEKRRREKKQYQLIKKLTDVEQTRTHRGRREAVGIRRCVRRCSGCWGCRIRSRSQSSWAGVLGSNGARSSGSC